MTHHKVLKVALRFERMLEQRRLLEECREMNDQEFLNDIVSRYNNYKATAAIRKWQLSQDMANAVSGIVLGICPDAREEIRGHLDHNKWEQSGHESETMIFLCILAPTLMFSLKCQNKTNGVHSFIWCCFLLEPRIQRDHLAD